MHHPWPIPDLLPTGVTLLTGHRHTGKSWLALNLAMAFAGGYPALGRYPVAPGNVLHIGMEYPDIDANEAFIKERVFKTLAHHPDIDIGKIDFTIECSLLDYGGEDCIEEWLDNADPPRLIIIDPLHAMGVTPCCLKPGPWSGLYLGAAPY
jgi:RecA-family ATPase